MKNILLVSTIALFLVGCTTPSYNYVPKAKNISKPPVGEVSTAYLGDHMLTQGMMVEHEALRLISPFKIQLAKISTGYFAKQGEDEQYINYKTTNDNGSGKIIHPLGGADAEIPIVLRKSDNALCLLNGIGTVVGCKTGADFEKTTWSRANTNSFQQTLIYNGKVGNKINVAYREFSSDLARPAFNNNVEYDLSDSKQIGYKGALLDVIDANNQQIKYKVIRNFNE